MAIPRYLTLSPHISAITGVWWLVPRPGGSPRADPDGSPLSSLNRCAAAYPEPPARARKAGHSRAGQSMALRPALPRPAHTATTSVIGTGDMHLFIQSNGGDIGLPLDKPELNPETQPLDIDQEPYRPRRKPQPLTVDESSLAFNSGMGHVHFTQGLMVRLARPWMFWLTRTSGCSAARGRRSGTGPSARWSGHPGTLGRRCRRPTGNPLSKTSG